MEFCTMWVILYMSALHLALSYKVTLLPKSFITDVGNHTHTFICRIQLESNETTLEHGIIWWKDNIRIIDNDIVLTSSAKYSVHGVSSMAISEYSQILQVNGIQQSDHGIYACTLVFPSYPPGNTQLSLSSHAIIIIKNFISQPRCSTIPSKSEAGQQQITLSCKSSPSDPPITLHWIDYMGNFLTSKSQMQSNELLTISHTVSVSESGNQWFTCRANSSASTETKECVIDVQAGDKNNTIITITIIVAVAGVIFVMVVITLALLLKCIKKGKKEESESPNEVIDTHNGNQLSIELHLGYGQLDDQCFPYKSTTTDTDDPVDLKNVEESRKHVAMDNNKKAKDIYPFEYNGKTESVPSVEVKADDMFSTVCSPNAVISQNEDANKNDDPYPMDENMMYVSADEVKLNERQPVMHYTAESGDIYAAIVKS